LVNSFKLLTLNIWVETATRSHHGTKSSYNLLGMVRHTFMAL